MVFWVELQCPWCWESQSVPIEADLRGAHVIDCQVCCRPWRVTVTWEEGAESPDVYVDRS